MPGGLEPTPTSPCSAKFLEKGSAKVSDDPGQLRPVITGVFCWWGEWPGQLYCTGEKEGRLSVEVGKGTTVGWGAQKTVAGGGDGCCEQLRGQLSEYVHILEPSEDTKTHLFRSKHLTHKKLEDNKGTL